MKSPTGTTKQLRNRPSRGRIQYLERQYAELVDRHDQVVRELDAYRKVCTAIANGLTSAAPVIIEAALTLIR